MRPAPAGTYACDYFPRPPHIIGILAVDAPPEPVFNCVKSLTTHTLFGLGLYLAAARDSLANSG
jgi:hypothetical protein